MIAPVDYQGSNFSALVFSGSRPSASPSKKQTREMRASPRKPKFPFFHFVFIQFSCFSSFFNWKSYNARVWHKVENVDLYLSIKVWMKVRWHTDCRCWMLWGPHPTFESSKSQVSKAFLWKQKTIANRNQLFKLFEELLPTKRSSHLNKNCKSFGYRYTRFAISWIRFVLKAAFRTSKLSTVSKLMNESAVLRFTEDSLRTKLLLTVLSPSFEIFKKIELSLSVAVN